jgi:hypothetical protein
MKKKKKYASEYSERAYFQNSKFYQIVILCRPEFK